MDDTQRTRLIILAVSGLVLGGGVYGYMVYQNQKAQQADLEAVPMTSGKSKLKPAPAVTEAPGQSEGVKTAGTTPVAPGGKPPPTADLQTPGAAPSQTKAKPTPAETQATTQPLVALRPKPTTASAPIAQSPEAAPVPQPQVSPVPSASPGQEPATTMAEAEAAARRDEAHVDPVNGVKSFHDFPRRRIADSITKSAEPPKVDDKLVPPPPPNEPAPGTAAAAAGNLDITQLPLPPSKPSIGDKLIVLAVMDDKAILTFPKDMRMKNKWPKTLTLGPGEQFESINIVAVDKDGVTIEEDGEKSVKALPAIK